MQRYSCLIDGSFGWRAFVELHHDVGIERALNLHRDFRRKEQLVSIDWRREVHALFHDLSQLSKRPHLKAAGVRENWAAPAHEVVQTFELVDDRCARPQPEVKRIAKNNLRANIGQHLRRHGFDRAVSAHRHEDRCFNHAVIEVHAPASRVAVSV